MSTSPVKSTASENSAAGNSVVNQQTKEVLDTVKTGNGNVDTIETTSQINAQAESGTTQSQAGISASNVGNSTLVHSTSNSSNQNGNSDIFQAPLKKYQVKKYQGYSLSNITQRISDKFGIPESKMDEFKTKVGAILSKSGSTRSSNPDTIQPQSGDQQSTVGIHQPKPGTTQPPQGTSPADPPVVNRPPNPPAPSQLETFGKAVVQEVAAAFVKDLVAGGPQRREYERKMYQEQERISDERRVQQQKIQQEQQRIVNEEYAQRRKVEQERARIAQEKYTQDKKGEIDFLRDHGYTYQPSQQDLVELTKNQLILESARNKYKAMGYFSSDFLLNGKGTELANLIKDSEKKVTSLQNSLAQQRFEWDKKSLQEIADNNNTKQNNNSSKVKSQPVADAQNSDAHVDMKNLTSYRTYENS